MKAKFILGDVTHKDREYFVINKLFSEKYLAITKDPLSLHNQKRNNVPISIDFESSELPELVEFYRSKRAELIAKLEAVDAKLNAIEHHKGGNKQYNHFSFISTSVPEYSKDGTWLDRIATVILQLGGKASTKKIVEKLQEIEPDNPFSRSDLVSKVSAILSINSKPGKRIEKITSGDEYEYRVKTNEEAAISGGMAA